MFTSWCRTKTKQWNLWALTDALGEEVTVVVIFARVCCAILYMTRQWWVFRSVTVQSLNKQEVPAASVCVWVSFHYCLSWKWSRKFIIVVTLKTLNTFETKRKISNIFKTHHKTESCSESLSITEWLIKESINFVATRWTTLIKYLCSVCQIYLDFHWHSDKCIYIHKETFRNLNIYFYIQIPRQSIGVCIHITV